jgi:hypothetical protein
MGMFAKKISVAIFGFLGKIGMLHEGATDVALHGSAVLEEMLHLPPME